MSAKSLDLSWSWILVILVNDEIYEFINIKLYTVINQLKYGIFVVTHLLTFARHLYLWIGRTVVLFSILNATQIHC